MSYGTYHFNHCFACLLSYLEQRVLLPWSYFTTITLLLLMTASWKFLGWEVPSHSDDIPTLVEGCAISNGCGKMAVGSWTKQTKKQIKKKKTKTHRHRVLLFKYTAVAIAAISRWWYTHFLPWRGWRIVEFSLEGEVSDCARLHNQIQPTVNFYISY